MKSKQQQQQHKKQKQQQQPTTRTRTTLFYPYSKANIIFEEKNDHGWTLNIISIFCNFTIFLTTFFSKEQYSTLLKETFLARKLECRGTFSTYLGL